MIKFGKRKATPSGDGSPVEATSARKRHSPRMVQVLVLVVTLAILVAITITSFSMHERQELRQALRSDVEATVAAVKAVEETDGLPSENLNSLVVETNDAGNGYDVTAMTVSDGVWIVSGATDNGEFAVNFSSEGGYSEEKPEGGYWVPLWAFIPLFFLPMLTSNFAQPKKKKIAKVSD